MSKSTIVVTVFLIISVIVSGVLFMQKGNVNRELSETTTQLVSTQEQLTGTETELTNTQSELTDTKSELADTQGKLTVSENKVTDTEAKLSTTENQLEDTKSQLSGVTTQLTATQDENTRMTNNYSSLRAQIDLKLGRGEDSEKFITPNDPLVVARAIQIAGTYTQDANKLWRDYQRLYQWVVDNIKYNYDTNLPLLPMAMSGDLTWEQEYWRMPEETLNNKVGDCEDMAALLASLMLSYNNQQYGVWAIIIRNQDSGHVAVALPVVGKELSILDPAGKYYTGYRANWLRSFEVGVAVSDWLAAWAPDMPGAKITAVFSDDFYKEFSGTQDFINWAKTYTD